MGQLRRHPFIVFESFYVILSSFFLSEWLLLALTCCFVCKFSVEQGNTTGNHNTYIVRMKFCWDVSNETGRYISEKERRARFAAFVIECIVIFLLNAFTLATYIRNRHLRKRSTYLIINLTVAGITGGNIGWTFFYIGRRQPEDGEGSWTRFKLAIIYVFNITGAFFSCFIS